MESKLHPEETNELRQRTRQSELEGHQHHDDNGSVVASDRASPGVARIEAITTAWNRTNKIWFLVALILLTCG